MGGGSSESKAEWDIPRVFTYTVIDLNEPDPDKAIIWKKVTTERLHLSLTTKITYPEEIKS